MFFNNRRSFLKPALRAITPEPPNKGVAEKSAIPTLTSLVFQILLVANIIKISVIDLYVFLKKSNKSKKKLSQI